MKSGSLSPMIVLKLKMLRSMVDEMPDDFMFRSTFNTGGGITMDRTKESMRNYIDYHLLPIEDGDMDLEFHNLNLKYLNCAYKIIRQYENEEKS